jgi:aminoglycoside 3-N-acetyltransferase
VTKPTAVTKSTMIADLGALGVGAYGESAVMVHARMSALGRVIGGAQTIVEALTAALAPRGTLLVLTGWQDRPPYHQQDWDETERRLYRAEAPAFDPLLARAEREHGRVPEAVRTWPGARHSRHPVGAFAALGPAAAWLVAGQALDEAYGAGSPLARLVEADGAVLLLGDLFDSVTLLHHAEYCAAVGPKRWVAYEMPVWIDGRRAWRRIQELDSSAGALPYEDLALDDDAFAVITRAALAAGVGRSGPVGAATGHLLPARRLLGFACAWLEERFGASA